MKLIDVILVKYGTRKLSKKYVVYYTRNDYPNHAGKPMNLNFKQIFDPKSNKKDTDVE